MNEYNPVMLREHESEAALLAHVLNHPERASVVLKDLSPASFDHPHHRGIAWQIWQHLRTGVAWDVAILSGVMLKEIAKADGSLNEEAKLELITFTELASQFTATTAGALEEHLRRVHAASEKRHLHQLLLQSAQQVMAGDALAQDVFTRVEDFRRTHTRSTALAEELDGCLVSNPGLQCLSRPQRRALMGDFFKEGDLAFIYAPRGAGKTWLAMMLANARAENRALGEWPAGEFPARVLYVDGEMHLEDTKMRSEAIGSASENFLWLHGDLVYERTERTLNLCEREWQDRIMELCKARGVTELYLDNLSCLVRGMMENDNDDWRELVFPWLLELRRMKISVVIVAHAGRQEHMRGASGKEDAAQWVLKLRPADEELREQGAAFITEFTKSRNTRGTPPSLLWRIQSVDGGRLSCTCEKHGGAETLVRHVLDGVSKNKELAEMMGMTPGSVSKLAKKAADSASILIRGGYYHPPEKEQKARAADVPLDLVAA